MSGLDVFVTMCWVTLGLIPLGLMVVFISGGTAYFIRSNWSRAGENVWRERLEKIKAER